MNVIVNQFTEVNNMWIHSFLFFNHGLNHISMYSYSCTQQCHQNVIKHDFNLKFKNLKNINERLNDF